MPQFWRNTEEYEYGSKQCTVMDTYAFLFLDKISCASLPSKAAH